MALRVGLNPYGLTFTLGFQGAGTPRANPAGSGLDGFLTLAAEYGARTVELDWRWLAPLSAASLAPLRHRTGAAGQQLVVSAWLTHEPGETLEAPIAAAHALGAALVRLHLTPVLEGGRAALGPRWAALVEHAQGVLKREAAYARQLGLRLGIENHQDFGSEELLDMAEAAGDNVGIVFDTGNPFAVGEDPVAFARRVAARVCHLHLKDYRAQFTDEGYRLVRCAIGDGCVPFREILPIVAATRTITASIEPAALDARHIRLFTSSWWQGYRPRDAQELGTALGRLRHRCHADSDDVRTPWEGVASARALVEYELDQLRRSFAFAQTLEP